MEVELRIEFRARSRPVSIGGQAGSGPATGVKGRALSQHEANLGIVGLVAIFLNGCTVH